MCVLNSVGPEKPFNFTIYMIVDQVCTAGGYIIGCPNTVSVDVVSTPTALQYGCGLSIIMATLDLHRFSAHVLVV